MNYPRVRVSVLICKDGKVLLGKPKQTAFDGYCSSGLQQLARADTWGTPGGKLELGESFEACALREVAEETGLEITNVRFCAVTNTVFDEQTHWINIFVCADLEQGEAKNLEPDKCAAWCWFDWDKLPDNVFPAIKSVKEQGIRL